MPVYKAHIIDSDRRFKNSIDLDLSDDGSAIEVAKRLAKNDHTVELWDGRRKVASFKGGT